MSLLNAGSGVELTTDRLFKHRVRRLVVVSTVALGVIWGLAFVEDAEVWVLVLLGIGWVLMPTILALSLGRPLLRYALLVPATAISTGLIGMTIMAPDSTDVGWLLITLGVVVGGVLGAWFWFRWLPVPRVLDDPYGTGRVALVGLHTGLVIIGVAIVVAGL
jgi:hypothetical protein